MKFWGPLVQDAIAAVFRSQWAGADYNWRLPVSSPFGFRADPMTGETKHHNGIDIAVAAGTPIIAVYDGEISRIDAAGNNEDGTVKPNGNAVFLKCGIWTFCYLHLSAVSVTVGQNVTRGEVLGRVGSTGRSTGPHLHFQVYMAGRLIDPAIFYPGQLLTGA